MIGRLISMTAGRAVNVVLTNANTIGAAAENDICLVGAGVITRHARITQVGDRWQLETLGGVLLLNGVAVQQPVLLSPFDILTVGTELNLVFRQEAGQAAPAPKPVPPPSTPPPPPPQVRAPIAAEPADPKTVLFDPNALLNAMAGAPPMIDEAPADAPAPAAHPAGGTIRLRGSAGEWTLTDGVHVIGRSPECHVRIDSRQISREHAYLAVSSSEIFLETANDRNGTSVNGAPIKGRVRVAPGDRLGFAGIELEIRVE